MASSTPSFKEPLLPSSAATPPSLKPTATAAATTTTTPVTSSPVKPELSTPRPAPTPQPVPSSSDDADVVLIPSYSRWFSWNGIHDCEVRFLPEFFDSRSPAKNPKVYKYYRNSIVKYYRQHYHSGKINFTEVRRTLVGDVGSIRRVYDFLEAWGLVNYSPNTLNKPLKWEDKETKASAGGGDGKGSIDSTPPKRDAIKRLCSGCQSVCTIACFVCDKYDLTLCARCYVRGNYRVGVSSTDFRRVEISEEIRSEWTEKETLQLLEAVTHFGDDWKKVALHVPGRTDKDCVAHFVKLPFGENFAGYADLGELNDKYDQMDSNNTICGSESNDSSSPSKRIRLTPLADASNPIMGQAAFLSALAGTAVAEAAAQAAVTALSEARKGSLGSLSSTPKEQGTIAASNGITSPNGCERSSSDANLLHEKEAEGRISRLVEVEMKEMQEKIVHFEELDLQMEKEWQQLELMKNLLFVDQLTLLFHKKTPPKSEEHVDDHHVKT